MLVITILNIVGRKLDSQRAEHFEESVACAEQGRKYDGIKNDVKVKNNISKYYKIRTFFELIVLFLLVITMVFLFMTIQNNAPF